MERVAYGGWDDCARLTSGEIEAIVTLAVGPRVIRLGFTDGPNMFVEYPKAMGLTGGDEYRSYGGHRLWIAPEDRAVTYEPDNDPVEVFEVDDWTVFVTPLGASRLRRQIGIRPSELGFTLLHSVTNESDREWSIAPWCLSVMAPGGVCVFPQAPFQPHPEALLPARPLVLWPYTEMTDDRYTWGARRIRVRQDERAGPTKVGSLVTQGIAAYSLHGHTFVKRFPYVPGADYLDFGCNFEMFTRHDMLEVESLGPRQTLRPGEAATLVEQWLLLRDFTPPEDDDACGDWLESLSRA